MKKLLMLFVALTAMTLTAAAQEYVVVGKTTNLYSEPSTSTPMLNQWDDTIELLPGMAFEKKGESGDYYIIDITGWQGTYLPKSACAAPETFEFTGGTYQMKYEPDTYAVEFTSTGDGKYNVSYQSMTDLKATTAPEGIIVITDPSLDGDMVGCVSCVGSVMRVWIYDTTVLPWN
ncbi:MAG: hypothetical protein NC339_02650 [Muribaculaceae bacterium]|nr:hypothetical protein [Muribaculaceae bacterium]